MAKTSESNIGKKEDKVLLDFIQHYASIGTWEFNINSTELFWSSETKNIHEVPQDYIPNVAEGISFYKEGYSQDTIKKLFKDCLENHESFDTELQIVTAKGNEKWVRAIGKPIIENDICTRVQGLFQDINEKTTNSKKLAFKEEQLRTTFDHALVGMAILDLDGKWLKVNKSLCKTFGYSEKEFLELSFLDLTHSEDKNIGRREIIDMINGKVNHFETEKRYINKNGKVIWTLLSTSIVKNDKGEPQHFVAQINDLTQAKLNETKLEQLLHTTKNQNERLLNFAHIVSHNLRSHYSNLDMLLDIVKVDHPETTKNEVFPLIQQAVNSLGETINNLNEVAAINIKNAIKREPINLLNSFNSVVSTIAALVLETNTKISHTINSDLNIYGIPAYLDSILLNLLTNAIKYKKPNVDAKIKINAAKKADYTVLEITDNGLGIDLKKHEKKLFGMYKTFHKHKESKGLGLFIAKNQIDAIGGKIEVKSKVNIGTTFYLYFKTYEKN